MIEILIISILLIFALTYFFTRNEKQTDKTTKNIYSAEYYRGLNYLLNNEDDKALKIFTDLIDVDSSTIETHLALGGVYRRRGEFDKAILIHQNLLSRPKLDRSIKNQSMYELAKDFFSAGLYDKSEKILLNLKDNSTYQQSCNEYLLLIYELSKDWDNAINFSKNLKVEKIRKTKLNILMSQYYCEKANEYKNDSQLNKCFTVLRKALDVNESCIRSYVTLLSINLLNKPYDSLENLTKLLQINTNTIPIISELLIELSVTHQDEKIDKTLHDILLGNSESSSFVPNIYELLLNIGGEESSRQYIKSVRENVFAEIYDQLYKDIKLNNDIDTTKLINMIKDNFLIFSCNNCGYTSKEHVWQCPSCNSWESIYPLTMDERILLNGR